MRIQNRTIILMVVLALTGGIFLGRASVTGFGRRGSATTEAEYQLKYENLRSQLEDIHKIDIEEYLALKDQKAKYEKADEILGKMILIFLADLGLNISKDKFRLASQVAGGTGAVAAAASASPSAGGEPQPEAKWTAPSVGTSSGKDFATGIKQAALKAHEKTLDDITSEEQAKKFLEDAVLSDFFEAIKGSKPMSQDQMQALTGTFAGRVNFDDKNQDPWDVEMSLEGSYKDNKPSGNADIKIFKQGQPEPFSHASSDGNIKHVQGAGGESQAMIIDAFGGDGYFQLYAPKKLGFLVGNYYQQESPGSFKKTGVVTLQRR